MLVAARMKTLLILALGLVDVLSAQEPKPGSDLPKFRAHFESGRGEPAIAIAFVPGGEPLVLCAGHDAGGEPVTARTLVPLLGLAKVLAADALHVQRKGKLDVGSGVTLGGRELSVLELLNGTSFDILLRAKAFETDLFAARGGFAGWSAMAPTAVPVPVPAAGAGPLAGTRWGLPAGGKESRCRLTFGATLAEPTLLEMAGFEGAVTRLLSEGECLTGVMRGTVVQRQVWIRPRPDAAAPTRLTVIVLTTRGSPPLSRTAGLPSFLDLVPEAR